MLSGSTLLFNLVCLPVFQCNILQQQSLMSHKPTKLKVTLSRHKRNILDSKQHLNEDLWH